MIGMIRPSRPHISPEIPMIYGNRSSRLSPGWRVPVEWRHIFCEQLELKHE